MGGYENLRLTREDGVAYVRMESTARMNALTEGLIDELAAAADGLAEDGDVRCIALTGSGESFSAGADLTAFEGDGRDAATMRGFASRLHDAVIALHQAGAPVVTAVNGVAAGAGFGLAIMGDVVLVSDGARLDFAYDRMGLTGDGGSTYFLPRLVGTRRAKEVVLLEDALDPERAVGMGLATEVVPADDLDDRLAEVAGRIADGPTKALAATTRLLDESLDRSIEGQLAAETEAMAGATRTDDYGRGYRAFFGDGEPEFTGS